MNKVNLLKNLLKADSVVKFVFVLVLLTSFVGPLILIDESYFGFSPLSLLSFFVYFILGTIFLIFILKIFIFILKQQIQRTQGLEIKKVVNTEKASGVQSITRLLGHIFLLIYFGFSGLFGLAQISPKSSWIQILVPILVFGLIMFAIVRSMLKK